jgi:hypothetical protein
VTERPLRRALVAVTMVAALLVVAMAAIVFYWQSYLLGPSGEVFTRGPYLVRVDETSAELAWRVRGSAPVEVIAWAPDAPTVTAADGRFAALRTGTRYTWTANVDGIARAAGSFRTAPLALDEPITVVAIGDYGSGSDHEWAVARIAAAQDPALALTTGDNSYLVAAAPLLDRNIFRPLAPLLQRAPLVVGLGDHDTAPPGPEALMDAFDLQEERYVAAYGPLQVIVLGVDADTPGTAEFAERALAAPGFSRRLAVVHRPLQPGDPLLDALRGRVDAVLAGHLHRYERRVVDGVLSFTVGTSGQGPGDLDFTKPTAGAAVSLLDYGLLRIDLRADGTTYTFIDERGRVLDRLAVP